VANPIGIAADTRFLTNAKSRLAAGAHAKDPAAAGSYFSVIHPIPF